MANKTADQLVSTALKDEGYIEKKSNAWLNSKTKNAGSNNWTKFNAYFGYSNVFWCANYVSYEFAQAFGKDEGKKLLYGGYSASCEVLRQQFIKAGKFDATPKVGDCIFFKGTRHAGANHIAIIISVTSTTITTIEGNTSGGSSVVDNGGGVFRKTYKIGYEKIMGYGHPAFDTVPVTVKVNGTSIAKPVLRRGVYGAGVKALQKNLNKALGIKLSIDGDFGKKTFDAVVSFQKKYLKQEQVNGIYDNATYKAMKKIFKK